MSCATFLRTDDEFRITWLEAVLYKPDGERVNDPRYTFSHYEGDGRGDDLEDEGRGGRHPQYPPVEPYQVQRFIAIRNLGGLEMLD